VSERTIDLRAGPARAPEATETARLADLPGPEGLRVLVARLRERGIETLAELREAARVETAPELALDPADPAVRAIAAHMALDVLPTPPRLNERLIEAGIESPLDLAETEQPELERILGDDAPPQAASALRAAASAQSRLASTLLVDRLASTAAATTCGCNACRNATSPLAYLADLLTYAVGHVRQSGSAVTVDSLAARFHQPLAGLPATCESLETTVRTARICCEVLRSYLSVHPAPAAAQSLLADKEGAYLWLAYTALLERNGTSFAEIRAARSATRHDRVLLARRLGVDLDPSGARPDALDRLFVDPDAAAGAVDALAEQALERIFGLRDTYRDPLDPDPTSELLDARLQHLRRQWVREDWPQSSPSDASPTIDPDVIGPSDLRDPTAGPAFELYEQRYVLVEGDRASARNDYALAGFDALVQSRVGLTPIDIADLAAKREGGTPIVTLLPQGLDEEGFDQLLAVGELERTGGATKEELEDAYSVLTQVRKRGLFPTWRQEERSPPMGGPAVTLTQDNFRLPLAPGGDRILHRFRAAPDARRRFFHTLRARIDQEQSLIAAAHEAVDATEEETLVVLRDGLVFAAGSTGTLEARQTWATRHLQVDAAVDACATTTRPAQAIETLQGVLFGARHGLLEDPTLTLAAPSFDEEWRWIGSYASWRAAMLVFLYPEVALRPTLRRVRSAAFDTLVGTLRDGGQTTPAAAQTAALGYGAYFADVCSLAPAAVYRTTRPLDAGLDPFGIPRDTGRRVLALARAGASGKLYFSAYTEQPGTGVAGGSEQTLWQEIVAVPAAAQPAGLVPFQPATDQARVALYTRLAQTGAPERVLLSTYDGTAWNAAAEAGSVPALVRACELAEGVVASDPALTTLQPWQVRGDDRVVPVDLDGDGRDELVLVAAATEADGTRRVGVARERDGGLVLTWSGQLPAGWDLPPGRPVTLERRLNVWPWRCKRLLLVNSVGQDRLGVFGNGPTGVPALLASTTDAGGWTVVLSAVVDSTTYPSSFVRADIDGSGDDELVVLVHGQGDDEATPVSTTVVALDFAGDAFSRRFSLDVRFPVEAAPYRSSGRSGRLEQPIAVRSGFSPSGSSDPGREDVLVRATRYENTGLDVWENREWVLLLRFDAVANSFAISWHSDDETGGVGPGGWRWNADDQFLPLELKEARQAILVSSSSQAAVGMLGYAANGDLALRWRTQADHRIGPGSGSTRDWTVAVGDRVLPANLDGDGRQQLVLASADGTRLGVAVASASSVSLRAAIDRRVAPPVADTVLGWTIAASTHYAAGDLDGDGYDELAALTADARLGLLRSVPRPSVAGLPSRLGPVGVTALDISPKRSSAQLDARQPRIASAYAANATFLQNSPYLDEAYLHVPLELALRLDESGEHEAALDWLASVYDWTRTAGSRKIARRLVLEESVATVYERAPSWLADPLDAHAIAGTRREAYTRFTLLTIVRCLLGFADEDFTRATVESVPRARALYLTALALLDEPALGRRMSACSDLIATLDVEVGDPEWGVLWREAIERLGGVERYDTLTSAVEQLTQVLSDGDGWPQRLEQARAIVDEAIAADTSERALGELVTARHEAERTALSSVLDDGQVAKVARRISDSIAGAYFDEGRLPFEGWHGKLDGLGLEPYSPPPPVQFCVPPNPLVDALRRRAELNLHKIHTCRNIAGLTWHPEPYAVPLGSENGELSAIATGRLPDPTRSALQPLPYRYATLVERARQLVQLASQIEASLLSTIEKHDAEAYSQLKGRQDLALARASVRLKDLQAVEANDGITLAELQRDRAQLQADNFAKLLGRNVSPVEVLALLGHGVEFVASVGLSGGAGFFGMIAGWDRRQEEWRFNRQLAQHDIRVGSQQVLLAVDKVQIAGQEQTIATLQADHAEELLDYLTTRKVANALLYDWMSGVLASVYRFFLQQATSMARLAEAQLAFERQEITPAFIQSDYWEPPQASSGLPNGDGARFGLTGSARLSRDLVELDQHAFRTDQRKLQLTKTISLVQHDPYALEQFRETGVVLIDTPLELFDRDFPGDYVRLVKRVRVSLIALIPPTEGIRATLSTTGTSSVVIGGDGFSTTTLQRGPESVALSSPTNASGVFELDPQAELLAPFEGIGLGTTWQLRMPKASNPFDYSTIADVLLTLDYTALHSFDLEQQVLRSLDRSVEAERLFSLRNMFEDQWFDLHNPDQTTTPMTVTFDTRRDDFPPNLEPLSLAIGNVSLLYSRSAGAAPQSWATDLRTNLTFDDGGGGGALGGQADPSGGEISTRSANGASWNAMIGRVPEGTWTLALPETATTRAIFEQDVLDDILLLVSYRGTLPTWPSA
jgi:hypothetical protein